MPEESPTKYVHLRGRADIRINGEGKIALYLYDPLTSKTIINEGNPFVFTEIPSQANPLRFLSIDIIAEFGETSFGLHLDTLKKIYPEITWERADDPSVYTIADMNSTDPPEEEGS